LIILRFCGRTSAVKVATPTSWPIIARCSSRTEPTPRPWKWSLMLKATSALVASILSNRPTPTMTSRTVATRATRLTLSTLVKRNTSRSLSCRSGAKNRR